MKLNSFLKEHNLRIVNVGEEFVLMYDRFEISPRLSSNEEVTKWTIINTSEIFYKLYTEGK